MKALKAPAGMTGGVEVGGFFPIDENGLVHVPDHYNDQGLINLGFTRVVLVDEETKQAIAQPDDVQKAD